MNRFIALKDLRQIPGVGKRVAEDLYELGYRSVSELKGDNPQKMYDRLCKLQGVKVDRCMLYTFRCAVYFASHKKHDPEKLLWWNHMDK